MKLRKPELIETWITEVDGKQWMRASVSMLIDCRADIETTGGLDMARQAAVTSLLQELSDMLAEARRKGWEF